MCLEVPSATNPPWVQTGTLWAAGYKARKKVLLAILCSCGSVERRGGGFLPLCLSLSGLCTLPSHRGKAEELTDVFPCVLWIVHHPSGADESFQTKGGLRLDAYL